MHFDGVVIVLAYGFHVYGSCIYCVLLCMCKCYIYIILPLIAGMRVSIFRQGETMFSFLIIYIQRPWFFNSGHNSTDAVVDVKYFFYWQWNIFTLLHVK
jgi:hypothetical protein